jgi:serine/threonine-protein kinase
MIFSGFVLTITRIGLLLLQNALLVLALLATAGVSAVATMRVVLGSQEVTVPLLLQTRISEAGALARQHGLLLKVEGKRHDPKVPVDRIAAQEPAPGSALKAHRSVKVWVSLGPERLAVPSVEGASLRSARLSLEQAGLHVARVVEVETPAEEGTVILQRPAAGEADSIGEGVSLLASRGAAGRDYLMPDLIGRKAEDVLDRLRAAGLKVAEVKYRSYPGVAAGVVLRQSPAAGHPVNPRTTVTLDISRGAS